METLPVIVAYTGVPVGAEMSTPKGNWGAFGGVEIRGGVEARGDL